MKHSVRHVLSPINWPKTLLISFEISLILAVGFFVWYATAITPLKQQEEENTKILRTAEIKLRTKYCGSPPYSSGEIEQFCKSQNIMRQ